MESKAILEQILGKELSPEEKILWVGKPVPRYFTPSTTVHFAGGIFWITCLTLALVFSKSFGLSTAKTWELVLLVVVFVPFFAFGFLLISSPLLEYRRMRRTIYSITSKRAIAFQVGRKIILWSHPLSEITRARISVKKDGVGDVVIVCGIRVAGESSEDQKSGFYNVYNPRKVATLLEKRVENATGKELIEVDEAEQIKLPDTALKAPFSKETPGKNLSKTLLPVFVVLFILGGLPLIIFRLPGLFFRTNSVIGIPAALFMVVFLFFLLQVRTVFFASRSTRWPTTEGKVVESYILADGDGGYIPKVIYTYRVNGKEYRNNEITASQRSNTLNRGPAEEIVARYPEGGSVKVYYHTGNPNHAVLEPGRGAGNWLVLAILAVCLLASGIWLVKTWRDTHLSGSFRMEKMAGPVKAEIDDGFPSAKIKN